MTSRDNLVNMVATEAMESEATRKLEELESRTIHDARIHAEGRRAGLEEALRMVERKQSLDRARTAIRALAEAKP